MGFRHESFECTFEKRLLSGPKVLPLVLVLFNQRRYRMFTLPEKNFSFLSTKGIGGCRAGIDRIEDTVFRYCKSVLHGFSIFTILSKRLLLSTVAFESYPQYIAYRKGVLSSRN